MSDNLLELKGVHTHIGAYHILHGVDLAVHRGQLTMLLGRNGAGKTTVFNLITGLQQPDGGAIRFDLRVKFRIDAATGFPCEKFVHVVALRLSGLAAFLTVHASGKGGGGVAESHAALPT